MTNFNAPLPLVNLQGNSALIVILLCIFFASFPQKPVFSVSERSPMSVLSMHIIEHFFHTNTHTHIVRHINKGRQHPRAATSRCLHWRRSLHRRLQRLRQHLHLPGTEHRRGQRKGDPIRWEGHQGGVARFGAGRNRPLCRDRLRQTGRPLHALSLRGDRRPMGQ